MIDCREALELCDNNKDVAYEYLRLKNSAVCRKKNINGKLVSWTDADYVAEAKKRYNERMEDVER